MGFLLTPLLRRQGVHLITDGEYYGLIVENEVAFYLNKQLMLI